METQRALLAIVISFAILFGYQYFFAGFGEEQTVVQQGTGAERSQTPSSTDVRQTPAAVQPASPSTAVAPVVYDREPQEITVETELFTAVISEAGGVLKSFVLKDHKETIDDDSPGMELVKNLAQQGYPLKFSWGSALSDNLLFKAQDEAVSFDGSGKAVLKMSAAAGNGLVIERIYTFDKNHYLFDLDIRIINQSDVPLQGIAELHQVNVPYEAELKNPASNFLFKGPVAYMNGKLHEFAAKDFKEGPKNITGKLDWAGYENHYFMSVIVPLGNNGQSFTMQGNEDLVKTVIAGNLDTLQPSGQVEYKYRVLYGPKKLTMLKDAGYNLEHAVDFGWFDIIAKPTLWLLNFFYGFCKNYGVAIILVTIMFKAIFWPITQKGMKSMKNMQKLQPKMVKIKEKYKSDPTRMNQEIMALYKTYKVNPLGGCLPMILQIPVFFALYKVLLLSIELRHAPFMLWINDLSAPDRLWIGFDLPYLGGLPVLTLLMGASMFLQQKLTPTTADPTQAKIMMFLPVIFTFMFLNFSSGLVLYWFVNNLLSILQQVLINREKKAAA